MDELTEQILAEKENVDIALQNLKTALARNEKTVIELAAIATFLHNIYNGIENILKQILISKEIMAKEPDGLILSGGPTLERAGNCSAYVKELDLPVLGICLGHQVMALSYGGEVKTGAAGGYAAIE